MAQFNIERFLQLSGAVRTDDLDFDLCRRVGLTDGEERILRYMADTETHTVLYMRDLLAGHSAADPEIISFLSVWVYEELYHGRALSTLLRAAGRPEREDHYTQVTRAASFRETIDAILSHAAAGLTPRFIAVHMAWGAINELTAAAAYQAVERETRNPVLSRLLNRIMRQERKHFSFYYQQAHKRLLDEPKTQALVNFALRRFWRVVGTGVAGEENLAFIAAVHFGDEEARRPLHDAEEKIRALPGLEWFDRLATEVAKLAENYTAAHPEEVAKARAELSSAPRFEREAELDEEDEDHDARPPGFIPEVAARDVTANALPPPA